MIKITSSKEGILGIGSWFFNGLVALKKKSHFLLEVYSAYIQSTVLEMPFRILRKTL